MVDRTRTGVQAALAAEPETSMAVASVSDFACNRASLTSGLLKVSATACVVGAIIGELPTGSRDGLGRALLEFSQQFGARPEKIYAAVIMSALAGILFVGAITLIELRFVESRRRPA